MFRSWAKIWFYRFYETIHKFTWIFIMRLHHPNVADSIEKRGHYSSCCSKLFSIYVCIPPSVAWSNRSFDSELCKYWILYQNWLYFTITNAPWRNCVHIHTAWTRCNQFEYRKLLIILIFSHSIFMEKLCISLLCFFFLPSFISCFSFCSFKSMAIKRINTNGIEKREKNKTDKR